MKEELQQFINNYAIEQSIPSELLSAVMERVNVALYAVHNIDQYTPLFDRLNKDKPSNLIVVNSLEDLEKEIDLSNKILSMYVVDGAVKDHQKGILERRCE